MLIFTIINLVLLLLALAFLVTQVIIPAVMGRQFFPMFRQQSELEDDVALAKQEKYDDIVEKQIAERQKATTQVQIAQANAKRAEQDAITIAKQGEATAAKAKWDQETIKAKVVTEAQQKLEVATLGAKEAEQFKREQILRGEGEAARKQAVMNADGALEKKLETYVEVQKVWAEAWSKYPGAMVPGVVMGSSGASGQNSMGNAQGFVDLMTLKAAKDLSVDMGIAGKAATAVKK